MKFSKPLPETITCIFYLEFDNSIRIEKARNFTTDFWRNINSTQLLCALEDVKLFLGVVPLDLLPQSIARSKDGTVIINTDPHTEYGSHWLAIHFRPQVFECLLLWFVGLLPLVPDIRTFIRRNSTVWDYNRRKLHSLTSNVCCKYYCLFAFYKGRGYTPNQFFVLFATVWR